MMKNKSVILLSMFFMNALYAQDCSGLKDREVVRLDKNDGPLVNGRIQDQDGIGTCYANAASVALTSALPGNPDVSYLQLAFSHAQSEVADSVIDRDSAYQSGTKNFIINGGFVCKTIEAVKNPRIGGVCKREDVALENSLFNPKTNTFDDASFAQSQIIGAVSDYYDAIKDKFGIRPGAAPSEIARRTAEFANFNSAFKNLIKEKQEKFGIGECMKPDLTNSETVFKNAEVRIYTYLKNKYGDDSKFSRAIQRIGGKPNPNAELYFFYLGMGGVYQFKGDELRVSVANKYSSSLKANYIGALTSSRPPKDALTAFKNALLKGNNKKESPIIDKLMSELSPEDIALLEKDYNRYVNKDDSGCLKKYALAYFKSDDGLIKDFNQDVCLKNYLPQGKSLQSMAQILDSNNLNNIDTLNAFLTKLPSMNYEQSMRAIVAPDCSDDKKIKIPAGLTCNSNDFNYVWELRSKLISDNKATRSSIERRVAEEEELIKREADAEYEREIAAIEAKYAGKIDSNSLDNKTIELRAADNKKDRKKANAHDRAVEVAPKKIAGADESRYWSEYYREKKSKFTQDAVSLLKDQKQVVPVTLCTRMFTTPQATSLRDGTCSKDSADSKYGLVGGYHSMAVIGVRCQKGKLNYLLQNSWGDWDTIAKTKNEDGSQHFENEYGKAWMDEDELMQNSFGYQVIKK